MSRHDGWKPSDGALPKMPRAKVKRSGDKSGISKRAREILARTKAARKLLDARCE